MILSPFYIKGVNKRRRLISRVARSVHVFSNFILNFSSTYSFHKHLKINNHFILCTLGTTLILRLKQSLINRCQFWPSGVVIACVCPCVRQSRVCLRDNSSKVRARITTFGSKKQTIFLKYRIVFGSDWAWPSGSNFTLLKILLIFIAFASLRYFLDELFHIPHGSAHGLITSCTPTGSRHGPWNSLVVYLDETTGVQPALDSAIGTRLNKLLSVFDILCIPHRPRFYMPTLGNCRNSSRTVYISIYFVQIPTGDSPSFIYIGAILSAVNTRVNWRVESCEIEYAICGFKGLRNWYCR